MRCIKFCFINEPKMLTATISSDPSLKQTREIFCCNKFRQLSVISWNATGSSGILLELYIGSSFRCFSLIILMTSSKRFDSKSWITKFTHFWVSIESLVSNASNCKYFKGNNSDWGLFQLNGILRLPNIPNLLLFGTTSNDVRNEFEL